MISMLDLKAYSLRLVFNFLGRLGGPLLSFGLSRDLKVLSDLCYGSDIEQRLDIFRPKSIQSGGLPVLIFFHGGGWISADKKIYQGIAATFSQQGFLTFNVNYRLAPKSRFSAPLQDATRALDWIYRNAMCYGGDRSVIVLAGDSAGAQIASWYASALHNERLFSQIGVRSHVSKRSIKGLLLFYGIYDFDRVLDTGFPFIEVYTRSFLGADSESYAKNSKLASPIRQVSRNMPPVWLCAGERDGLFTQSKAYAEALERHGVRCRTLFFSGAHRASHGFFFFRWLESSKAALASILEFLRDTAEVEYSEALPQRDES
jgi:acetyl esterase